MNKLFCLKTIMLGFMALIAVPSKAQTGNQVVSLTLDSPGSFTQGGFYVGPYNLTVATHFESLVCDDFVDEISVGEEWNANVYTFSDLSQTKYATAGLQSYGQAAWLYEEGLLNPSRWGDINYAIWAVFNPIPAEASGGWTAGSSNWLATAQQQTFTADEFPNIDIYTPTQLTGANAPQEFLGDPANSSSAIPEPSSLELMLSGLIAVMLLRRKR